jgi:DNA-directed RNA polymerase subunit RPC12/RpoP
MKPKTKLQVEVYQNAQRLLKHDKMMIEFAKTTCLKHVGYATKNRVICMECGEKFSSELVKRKRATCPHCNQKLVIEDSRKSTFEQKTYVAIAELYGEFQLIRNYLIESYHKVGMKAQYTGYEILQHWYLNDKKREVVARNHHVAFGCNTWTGYLEIRDKGQQKYWELNPRYDVYPEKYHPDSVFKKEYDKYGINHKLEGLTFLEAVRILPRNTEAETLLKAKQYDLISAFRYNDENDVRRYWPSIKICIRNKYYVSDSRMWFDYLKLLHYFHKDLRNAHYVCPKDLKKVHDRLMNKKRAILKKEDEDRRKARAIEQEAVFKTLKEKFMGLSFSDGLILIKVLESVQEYVEEGDKLHHCVFTNNYFSKPDSLVLSARIENEPVETIELSLKDFKILQCRGKHNQSSEHHDRILQLMNKNIRKIKQRLKQTA